MKYFMILFFCVALYACGEQVKKDEPTYVPVNLPKEEQPKTAGFYCPMKCEGEKVYETDRNPCPVCEMKLVHTK